MYQPDQITLYCFAKSVVDKLVAFLIQIKTKSPHTIIIHLKETLKSVFWVANKLFRFKKALHMFPLPVVSLLGIE